jgi:hypothetical protein
MPIILTDEIISATQPVIPGWNYAEFIAYKEKPNKDNSGVDSIFTFKILEGPEKNKENAGKVVSLTIYANAISAQVADECRKLTEALTALTKAKVAELKNNLVDPSDFIGTKVYIKVVDEPYEGKIFKRIVNVFPDEEIPF